MTQETKQHKDLEWLKFIAGSVCVVFATTLFAHYQNQISPTTVALSFQLVILLTATFAGRNAALFAAFVAALSFNYFFLPPYRTFSISGSHDWISWAVFIITALVTGQLSFYARSRAEEAEKRKREIEELYKKLQDAFEKASRAEALKQSDKLKTALLDAVTHDLRTPLTSIKAAVTSLLDDEKSDSIDFRLDEESKLDFLEIINEETDRLNRLIQGMVELAKAEAGAIGDGKTLNSIEEMVQTALSRAEKSLAGHRVLLEIEPRLPALKVDAKAVSEVIYTLLDNAAKYSPAETNIVVTARQNSPDTVKISVADEGRGVPLEMRERVFDKFFRSALSEREKQTIGGLGMGLAIARGIVESHGGRIWITDGANGHGTRVIFTVPIREI